eukprot:gene9511-11673_t
MDWEANVDGIRFYIDEVWPRVRTKVPNAQLRVVGRHPPASLTQRNVPGVTFTGFVDDVREHVRDAQAFVIPLRVGGGTRIKAFEAMAMGLPVVSTTIGIEGLDVDHGTHFLRADGAEALAEATLKLIADDALRQKLSRAARALVEDRFGHRVAADVFGRILVEAVEAAEAGSSVRPGHGIFVETRLRELMKSGQVESRVIAPVPWFPSTNPRWGDYA